jgi:hypothetical protein
LTNSSSLIYTYLSLDSVRVDSIFGQFDFTYTLSVGDQYGPFAAARRSDSLIAFWPIAGCRGFTFRAALLPNDVFGPASLTTPDCFGLPVGLLSFRVDSSFLAP